MGDGRRRPIRVRAHAKLTLSLRVLGRRGDGYHDLDGLMASITEPADEIDVLLTDGGPSSIEITGLARAVPDDESNLAARAAALVLDSDGSASDRAASVKLRVHKGIPAGAGLGGGSADAAAVLRALASVPGARINDRRLVGMGARLGSDVPFCLSGGLCRVRGRGEVLEPLDTPATGWCAVVAVPPLHVSTAAVYAAWDELGGPRSDREVPVPPALRGVLPALANDLEPAAAAVEPALGDFRSRLEDAGGEGVALAGSGSAHFAVTATRFEAEAVRSSWASALPELSRAPGLLTVAEPSALGVEVLGDA